MGWPLEELAGIEPFAIDQIQTVEFGQPVPRNRARFLADHVE
ncbi:MAG TPA: hypothetical protein VNP94_01645 [Actinomycetota bacterium]|nr:hypothetical protein [Actinomycetota bacterium]